MNPEMTSGDMTHPNFHSTTATPFNNNLNESTISMGEQVNQQPSLNPTGQLPPSSWNPYLQYPQMGSFVPPSNPPSFGYNPYYGMAPTFPAPPTIPTFNNNPLNPPIATAQIASTSSTSQMDPMTTGFFGNLSPSITDDILKAVLGTCGSIRKLKRLVDPAGNPKSFAFCEFEQADSLLRAFRLLGDFYLGGRNLTIKIEDDAMRNLKLYESQVAASQMEEGEELTELSKKLLFYSSDLKCLKELLKVLVGKKLTSSIDWVERKISALERLKEEEAKEREVERESRAVKKESEGEREREREGRKTLIYEDLEPLDDKRRKTDDAEESKIKSRLDQDKEMAFKEREKRWEAKEIQIEKNLLKDKKRDEERQDILRRDYEESKVLIESFDDSAVKVKLFGVGNLVNNLLSLNVSNVTRNDSFFDFYNDRADWRAKRSKERAREEALDLRDEEEELKVFSSSPIEHFEMKSSLLNHRKPLLANEELEADLARKGLSRENVKLLLAKQKYEKIKALVSKIPLDREDLFTFPIDWIFFDPLAFLPILEKRIQHYCTDPNTCRTISALVFAALRDRTEPEQLIETLQRNPLFLVNVSIDASLLVMIVWRYLAYYTEAAAYKI